MPGRRIIADYRTETDPAAKWPIVIYMLLAGITSTAGGALFLLLGRVSITQTDFASQPNK